MDLTTITVQQFKNRFYRDFTYKTVDNPLIDEQNDPDFIQDQDILNAFQDAQALLNQALLGDNATITLGYLYLTAHCLCINVNNANAGLGATAAMPVSSRSVGGVSESYQIPDAYKNSAILQPYIGTAYGLRYLSMVLPNMVGNMVGVYGGTNP